MGDFDNRVGGVFDNKVGVDDNEVGEEVDDNEVGQAIDDGDR